MKLALHEALTNAQFERIGGAYFEERELGNWDPMSRGFLQDSVRGEGVQPQPQILNGFSAKVRLVL